MNNLVRYPLLGLSCLAVLAIITLLELGITVAVLGNLIILIVLFITGKRQIAVVALVLEAVCLLHIVQVQSPGPFHLANFYGLKAEVTGVVVAAPQIKGTSQVIIVAPTALKTSQSTLTISGGLLNVTLSRFIAVHQADQVTLSGTISKAEQYDNFNYYDYLLSQGIYAVLLQPRLLNLTESSQGGVMGLLDRLHDSASEAIRQHLPEPHASLLLGILIGSKEEVPFHLSSSLAATSTTHIIAVSGYNVTILLMAVLGLAGYLPRRLLLVAAGIILILFLILVGISNAPALRATLMGEAVIIGMLIGRKGSTAAMLMFAAALMLYTNPYVYKAVSFQLSFAATGGLVLLANRLQTRLPQRLTATLREELSVVLAANAATLPIMLINFHTLSLSGIIVNLLVLPLVPLITFLGFVMLLSAIPGGLLLRLLAIIAWIPLEVMIRILYFFAALPFTSLSISSSSGMMLIIVLAMIIAIILYTTRRSRAWSAS